MLRRNNNKKQTNKNSSHWGMGYLDLEISIIIFSFIITIIILLSLFFKVSFISFIIRCVHLTFWCVSRDVRMYVFDPRSVTKKICNAIMWHWIFFDIHHYSVDILNWKRKNKHNIIDVLNYKEFFLMSGLISIKFFILLNGVNKCIYQISFSIILDSLGLSSSQNYRK